MSPKPCCADTLFRYSERPEWKLRNYKRIHLEGKMETGQCEKQPKKSRTEKQIEIKIKTSE